MPLPERFPSIFKQGKDAHDRKVLRSACPFHPGSERCAQWTQGWDAALRARYGDRDALDARSDSREAEQPILTERDVEDIRVLGDLPKER